MKIPNKHRHTTEAPKTVTDVLLLLNVFPFPPPSNPLVWQISPETTCVYYGGKLITVYRGEVIQIDIKSVFQK